MFNKLLFSFFLRGKTHAKKIAYLGLLTAINVVFNSVFEFRTFNVQFSFTILVSVLTGIISGGISGFFVCFLADFLGFLINSWGYVYMPWVGLSTASLALFSGLIFYKNSNNIIVKTILISVFSLFICTILINSTGFYFYNKFMGFSTSLMEFIDSYFKGNVSYFAYIIYRLIFLGQIYNNIFNYALMFVLIPALKRFKIIN